MGRMVQVPFGHTTVSRMAPDAGPQNFRTFEARMPLKTHFVDATCAEVDCEAYRFGWASTFDLSTDLGQKQADYCKNDKSRSFSIQRPGPNLIVFVYPPGNQCFRFGSHKRPLGRPPVLLAWRGDFRARLSEPQVHSSAENWVDQMQENLDAIRTVQERG